MARMIDADTLRIQAEQIIGHSAGHKAWAILNAINIAPTIDSAPVRHGRWIESDTDGFVCSVCRNGYRNQPTIMGQPMFEFCPVCGAKMDGGTIGDPMEDDLK